MVVSPRLRKSVAASDWLQSVENRGFASNICFGRRKRCCQSLQKSCSESNDFGSPSMVPCGREATTLDEGERTHPTVGTIHAKDREEAGRSPYQNAIRSILMFSLNRGSTSRCISLAKAVVRRSGWLLINQPFTEISITELDPVVSSLESGFGIRPAMRSLDVAKRAVLSPAELAEPPTLFHTTDRGY